MFRKCPREKDRFSASEGNGTKLNLPGASYFNLAYLEEMRRFYIFNRMHLYFGQPSLCLVPRATLSSLFLFSTNRVRAHLKYAIAPVEQGILNSFSYLH